jgi:DNA polymerase III sliding clamp (beta) subunit (PCNA family)
MRMTTATTVAFEPATLADVIKKASKVAPTKAGSAFDKAAGIIMDVYPDQDVKVVVRATNEEIFYSEAVTALDAEGPTTRWRMSSMLLAHVTAALPTSANKVVRFTQIGSAVEVTCNRMKAKLPLIDPQYYPTWDTFDTDGLTQVADLGSKLSRVEWASSGDNQPPMCGIYLDGETATCTDRYRIARVPCEIDLPYPVIVPPGISNVIRQMGDVQIGVEGTNLLLAPDEYTQIRTVIFDAAFPPVDNIFNANLPASYPQKVEIHKERLIAYINNALPFAGAERNPLVKTIWGKGEVAVFLDGGEMAKDALFGDVIEVPGQIDHKRTTIIFSPKNLIPAISNSPSAKITIHYTDDGAYRPILIDGGNGYEAVVVPIKNLTA